MNHTGTTERVRWDLRACWDSDPDLFHGPEGERAGEQTAREAMAKQVCARCPIMDDCRDWALARREPFGVWGGMGERERDRAMGIDGGRRYRRTAPSPPADRFDQQAIREAIAELLTGDPDALRERLNKRERWEAVEILCRNRTPAQVAALIHVDPNTVHAFRAKRRRSLATRSEAA